MIYVLLVRLPGRRIRVGRLGEFWFEGEYAYVGSDRCGTRLPRHFRKGKVKRWHIDWLTEAGEVLGAFVGEGVEYELADHLARHFPSVPGFGSSDSPAKSHLFKVDGSLPGVLAGFGKFHKYSF